MQLLALDCTAGSCAVACFGAAGLLAAAAEPMQRGHAERIAPMMAETLRQAGLGPADLDAVAVTVGPGAFTGIRIGLAAAHGIALARGIPLLGVSCLEVAVAPLPPETPALAALETKRRDFYLQAFAAGRQPATEPAALAADRLEGFLPGGTWTVVGDAAERLVDAWVGTSATLTLDTRRPQNSAVEAGAIARRRWPDKAAAHTAPKPQPLYLRPPDVDLRARAAATDAAP